MSILKGFVVALRFGMLMLFSLIAGLVNLVSFIFPPAKKSVSGEIALITGAGSGLGRGMALSFARLGATIVAWDINEEANEATVQMIRQEGGKAFGFVCDCSKRDDIYRVAQQVKTSVGHVTILINNAGIVTGRKFLDCPDDLIQKTMDINTNAHFWTTKAFLPHMMEQNHGHLVSIASSAGLMGVAGLSDYCASKFGAVGFAESIRSELRIQGKSGVHVTCVCPTFINTGMFTGSKLKNVAMLEADDVVREIVAAVQRNQFMLVIPRDTAVFINLKG
ncbi:epidermal retinol dehydrogenase 2-like [Branchiostoma floridae]|uniref:Epidermal retinol dehydrogenase 2-like n=1 Tax=Branchiostoma floridae TaxID=7739 RepID=A0A9J7HIN6_BRAFL|nr:epidermal retinol dehydrogenase 2-like [Branchiostoma floridae]